MNSCHAKRLASCKVADAAPPLISDGGNQGGVAFFVESKLRAAELQPEVEASSVRGATEALRWHEITSKLNNNSRPSETSTRSFVGLIVFHSLPLIGT